MILELIAAVAGQINAAFGDGYELYCEDVKQGLKEPCFYISVLKTERKPMLGVRFFQLTPFHICFFPEKKANNCETRAVGEKLMNELEFITLADKSLVRGTNRSFEIVDGVLHFSIQYNMELYGPAEQAAMETLKIKWGKG